MNAGLGASVDAPIIVVGAGPVGLTAALALRAEGLPVTVLEAGTQDRARPGSRAIFYHRQTLEHWERMSSGLGWEIARSGLVWSTKRTFWGERQVFERTYQPARTDVLPHSTNLAQFAAERLLFDACLEAGVDFAWQQEIVAAETGPVGVKLHTSAGRGWESPFVVAADGSNSAMRTAIGADLQGDRSENSFVIVDVAEDPDQPLRPERLYFYEHPAVEKRHVLLVPFAGGWRADLMLNEDDDDEHFNDPAGVRRWIARVLPERYADRVTWVSTYQFLQVVARSFTDQHRRVLLIGEAAHLFAPFGARGLNSGVPDAVRAARAIRAALGSSTADQSAAHINQFADERRAAAIYNRDSASQALAHMRATDARTRLRRRAAARLALAGVKAGSWLDSSPFGPRAAAKGSEQIY